MLPRTIVGVANASKQGAFAYFGGMDPSSPMIREIGFVSVGVGANTSTLAVSVTSQKPKTIFASCPTHFDVGLERRHATLSSSVVDVVGVMIYFPRGWMGGRDCR